MNLPFRPFLGLLLIVAISSCATYERYELPKARLEKIDQDYLTYYLVDPAHPLSRVWYMSECKVADQAISCFLTRMTELEATEVTLVRNRRDARWSKNDVLFYADPKFAAMLKDTSSLTITLDKLEKIDVYELNHVKTFGVPLLSITGFLAALYALSW